MAKCPKCDGNGWKDNPRYWSAKAKYATEYYLRYDPRIRCRECKGTGYVVGDVRDAIDTLRVWKNNPQGLLHSSDFTKAVKILEKLFDE